VIDGEVLTVAAILHDIGIYPSVTHGGVYTAEGAELARELLPRHGWSAERVELCAQAIDRHHDVRRQRARGAEVEALRLADLVELSGGLTAAGLDRAWLRALYQSVPRRGLYGELAREVGRAIRTRPLTLPRIFLRP
jgi:HD superfamily phosphodiesterase